MAMLEDAVEEFKKLPTWGKIGIGLAAVGTVGVALYMRHQATVNGQSTPASAAQTGAAQLASSLPPTDLSGGGASGPISTPTGTGTGTTPSNPVQGFINLLSGTNGKGLLGSGATVYSAGNGQIYATQAGGITALLSSILPAGTHVYQGGQGRWWYQLPGETTQYLLTSGAGPDVPTGKGSPIGISTGRGNNGYTIGAPTSNPQVLQSGQLPG